jgi:hypothetical protein
MTGGEPVPGGDPMTDSITIIEDSNRPGETKREGVSLGAETKRKMW